MLGFRDRGEATGKPPTSSIRILPEGNYIGRTHLPGKVMFAMRLRSVICLALALPALIAVQGCIFSSGGGNHGGQGNHGYYAFTNPTPLSNWSLDSSYQVQWTANGTDDSG